MDVAVIPAPHVSFPRLPLIWLVALAASGCGAEGTTQLTIAVSAYVEADSLEDIQVCASQSTECGRTDQDGMVTIEVLDELESIRIDDGALPANFFWEATGSDETVAIAIPGPSGVAIVEDSLGVTLDPSRGHLTFAVGSDQPGLPRLAGIAGVTVVADPHLDILYANEQGVPDDTLVETSAGGQGPAVNEEPGDYTLEFLGDDLSGCVPRFGADDGENMVGIQIVAGELSFAYLECDPV